MQFKEIPGLHDLKDQLTTACKRGKVPHAQLFVGSPETAVMPLVMAYASYLMCSNRSDEDSCGTCPNCTRIKKLMHPDIHFVFPKISAPDSGKYDKVLAEALPKFRQFITTSPYGDIEEWAQTYGQENKNLLIGREDSRKILKNISLRSVEGGYKILIIWYPELMNASAANAILKVLEEPPEKTIYLLASYHYDMLLPTITSRSQLVVVPPSEDDGIKAFLLEMGFTEQKAKNATNLASGKIGAAIRLAKEEEPQEYQHFQKWMLECWKKNLGSLVKRSEDFSKSGKNAQRTMLNYAISIIRNAVIHQGGNELLITNPEEQAFVENFSDKLGTPRLEKIYQLINECSGHLERNSNPRITHLNLSLEIIRILNS